MLNSGILDVAIGIVFVYLLVSLIVTAANELVAAIFKMRGRILWQGVCNLLPTGDGKGKGNIAQQVYEHPLIEGLSRGKRPSYIPSRTFALALLDVISGGKGEIAELTQLQKKIDALPDGLKRPLNLLLSESKNNIDRFKTSVEVWFNNAMDRVSGAYKRRVQYALVFLSLILTIWLNVDTIVLANHLSHDSALRAALVSRAEASAKQSPPPSDATEAKNLQQQQDALAATIRNLEELRLPIGWSGPDADLMPPNFAKLGWWGGLWDAVRHHFVGWGLTALAASLGAPFWFDLLNRFVNIRSAGKAPEERPKEPKQVPAPAEPGATVNGN